MPFFEKDVFINAPFDEKYKRIFDAIIFAVVRYGYRVRCALEADNAGDNRFQKICSIISECKFGIHDISRTEVDGTPPLPRFNMPLELGVFLGAQKYGSKDQRSKSRIIFDREKYRYQKFISDIAGQDIHSHQDKPKEAIQEVTSWLRSLPGGVAPGGGTTVWSEYQVFRREMKKACKDSNIRVDELTFSDYHKLVVEHVATL